MSEPNDQIGVLLAARAKTYRQLLLTGLIVQLAAILIGAAAIYRCIGDDPSVANRFLRSLWFAVVWPPYLTAMAIPVSLVVLLSVALLIYFGLLWPRVRFLSFVGIFGWGAWWVWCAYVLCMLD